MCVGVWVWVWVGVQVVQVNVASWSTVVNNCVFIQHIIILSLVYKCMTFPISCLVLNQ